MINSKQNILIFTKFAPFNLKRNKFILFGDGKSKIHSETMLTTQFQSPASIFYFPEYAPAPSRTSYSSPYTIRSFLILYKKFVIIFIEKEIKTLFFNKFRKEVTMDARKICAGTIHGSHVENRRLYARLAVPKEYDDGIYL